MMRTPDENLRQYATPDQWETYVAFCEVGSKRGAATKLNRARQNVDTSLSRLFAKAAKAGYRPLPPVDPELVLKGQSILYDKDDNVTGRWDKTKLEGRDPSEVVQLPDPKHITKVSTLYDQSSRVIQQWVAEKPDAAAKEQLWRDLALELAKEVPRAVPTQRPKSAMEDQLACYPVGDHHTGMLAWSEENGGANYDIKIAEALLQRASSYLIDTMPPCRQALLVFLGDFMHYDSFESVTPTGRNLLDADGRYPKMVRAAIRMIRFMIEAALVRHGKVHVIFEVGNHDLSSTIFLMEMMHAIYENEPRVSVDTSPAHYHYYEFGRTLIGTHHGHGTKLENLPNIMAHDRAEAWGRTKHRYIWTGHVHTRKALDVVGVAIESFRVLPPSDAWAAQKGYRSIRDMKSILIDREHGEVARHTVSPDMFKIEEK